MAYRLTLTQAERKAIDWVGNRYRHGNELHSLLVFYGEPIPDDADWDDPRDMVFTVPEHVAWTISEIIDDGLDCFAPEFQHKLYEFQGSIV